MTKLKAVKSRVSGRFFRFEQYCEDGWGKYEDLVDVTTNSAFTEDDLPTFFSAHEVEGRWPVYDFKDHTKDQLEVVSFELKEVYSAG